MIIEDSDRYERAMQCARNGNVNGAGSFLKSFLMIARKFFYASQF